MAKAKATAQSSLERRIADLHISRYLRPYRRALACFVVVVLPDGVSSVCWKDAALTWSGKEEDWRFQEPVIVASDKALTDVSIARGRIVVLIERGDRDEYLEHTTIAAADAVVDIAEIDPKLIQLAFREVVGSSITHADATVLAAMPASRRRLISFAGRPVSEAIARLAAAQKKEDSEKSADKAEVEKKTSAPRLEDIHGYGEAKTWGLELARDIADYRAGIIDWSDVDGGLLLSGPPGTGKTTFAKALAETCGVGLVVGSYSTWLATGDGHQGDLLKAMRGAFDTARKLAPCIVFVDEFDNFVQRGSIGNGKSDEWMRGVVNGLLELVDGATSREGVIVIAACNDPSGIDEALRRSGRLDRHIELGLPDAGARMNILRDYLGVDLDLRPYLRRTEGMSGADLERVARDARRLARRERTEIEERHLVAALPTRVRRTPDSMRHLARHEIGHAVVGHVLGIGTLLVVHITQEFDPNAVGASVAGAAAFRSPDGELRNSTAFFDAICAKLGGLAAETMYYGTHAEGCVADLEEATSLATYMLSTLGMGGSLSSAGHRDQKALASARLMDPALARAVEEMLQEQAARAREILEQHREAVDELVELLILRGRLKGTEVIETVRAYELGPTMSEAV
ncbi:MULTISPECIES: AAA family ATPase [Rhizobium/Agrobacterium group]|uniref:Cell division protein n=1 Tax=Agrobacterium genomosp. 2 str. CFBP 5494 TaxID=1183436 RepID=A0A9W5F2X9_9HYPH|nr:MULTISPECIES: AAA family ATPase [Rhizobium/Agrobacterium group]CAD7036474.1 cell division protein [Rhizobium sp. P007]CUW88493.1 putative cell division protein [Agrobacterium genomosp. 2 str. CFBP 5494]